MKLLSLFGGLLSRIAPAKTAADDDLLSLPQISEADHVQDAASYAFIEEPVRAYWAQGAKEHLAGRLSVGIAYFRDAMRLQARLAKAAGLDRSVRYLPSIWLGNIGHIAHLEFIAKRKALGHDPDTRYVALSANPIGNACLLDYFAEYFEILTDYDKIRLIDTSLSCEYPPVFELHGRWRWHLEASKILNEEWRARKRGPLFALRPDHRARGERFMHDLGMPLGGWFVTLHVRENGWISGGYSTDSVRNAEIDDYLDCIRAITDRGGWVVRIGSGDYTPLPDLSQVIDYATRLPHEDWIDVYLLAAARFVIATNSGPAFVPGLFDTPALLTNWAPPGIDPGLLDAEVLPKRYFRLQDGSDLSDEEQRTEPIAHLESEHRLVELGIGVRRTDPDTITKAAKRMMG